MSRNDEGARTGHGDRAARVDGGRAGGERSDGGRAERAERVAVTGTPGTGKSTATAELDDEYEVIHLNDRIKDDESLWTERDDERDTLVADLEAIETWLGEWSGVLDSHLAHRFAVDRVVVLRCHPAVLERRLRERGESDATIRENAESEALDVILGEAVAQHGRERVYEIDATDRDPEAVATEIRAAIEGEREPSAGTVDFTEYLEP